MKLKSIFIVGTSAELIKIYPVMRLLGSEGAVELWVSNQQPEDLARLQVAFKTPSDVVLRDPQLGSLETRRQVPRWFLSVLWRSYRRLRRELRRSKHAGGHQRLTVFIHGDTMTSLVGAIAGRLAGARVVHVEAGLRSHNWRHPFPEELIRRLNARLAQVHFAPDDVAAANLQGVRGQVVVTHGNTSQDTFNLVVRDLPTQDAQEPFGLISLHRAELLSNQQLFAATIQELVELANDVHLIMVIDKLTQAELERTDQMRVLTSSRIELHQKMVYHDFIKLLTLTSFVITDSGGLQEECGNLGIPCLVHRMHTERSDGLGECVRLSNWEVSEFKPFSKEALRERRPHVEISSDQISPSAVIHEHFRKQLR